MIKTEPTAIILFDGICLLCSSTVRFIMKNDSKNRFAFASLQSDAAKEILLQFPAKKNILESLILIEDGNLYESSAAVLRIGKKLGWKFKWIYLAHLIPFKLRERLYFWIARNRYRWFGKRASCYLPSEKEKSKFL